MAKVTQVVLVEQDLYARNWMSLLLSRDLRTRVVDELKSTAQLPRLLENASLRIDLIIHSLDQANRDHFSPAISEATAVYKRTHVVLLVGSQVNSHLSQWLSNSQVKGYLLKDEINNSLAWAAVLAAEGNRVVTPGVLQAINSSNLSLQKPFLVLDGRRPMSNLTEHQARSARLAFIYSMERRELADELAVSEEWAYGLVSSLYEKLGLKDLLSDNLEPREYLGGNPLILEYFEKIRQTFQGSGKSRDMETLAFHLLTLPEIQELV